MNRAMSALGALAVACVVTLVPARVEAQAASVSGQGAAAAVTTVAGVRQFALAALPNTGGLADSSLTSVNVPNTLAAEGLVSMATGQVDERVASASATAEASHVNLLGGLITAQAVLAVATSYANGAQAASEASGSTLLGLEVNGVRYQDGSPVPNTRVSLPGVGYVVLNEQASAGDGAHHTGLTITMIHVYLTDATGAAAGDIVVGSARSGANQ